MVIPLLQQSKSLICDSRLLSLLGFHLADPFAAFQVMLASSLVKVNLVIGLATVVVIYLMLGGRFFC